MPLAGWPDSIRRATLAGANVIITSQCLDGAANIGRYAGSAAAGDAGALSAWDMTLEAALTRAMFLLREPGEFRELWSVDLAGEVTLPS